MSSDLPALTFQFSGFKDLDDDLKSELVHMVYKLGGRYFQCQGLHKDTTHIICARVFRSETILSGCASGLWILTYKYIVESYQAGHWLPEEYFEWSPDSVLSTPPKAHADLSQVPALCRRLVEKKGTFLFDGWKVAVITLDTVKLEAYTRILTSGGAECEPVNLETLLRMKKLYSLTHIFTERQFATSLKPFVKTNTACLTADYIGDYITQGSELSTKQYNIHCHSKRLTYIKGSTPEMLPPSALLKPTLLDCRRRRRTDRRINPVLSHAYDRPPDLKSDKRSQVSSSQPTSKENYPERSRNRPKTKNNKGYSNSQPAPSRNGCSISQNTFTSGKKSMQKGLRKSTVNKTSCPLKQLNIERSTQCNLSPSSNYTRQSTSCSQSTCFKDSPRLDASYRINQSSSFSNNQQLELWKSSSCNDIPSPLRNSQPSNSSQCSPIMNSQRLFSSQSSPMKNSLLSSSQCSPMRSSQYSLNRSSQQLRLSQSSPLKNSQVEIIDITNSELEDDDTLCLPRGVSRFVPCVAEPEFEPLKDILEAHIIENLSVEEVSSQALKVIQSSLAMDVLPSNSFVRALFQHIQVDSSPRVLCRLSRILMTITDRLAHAHMLRECVYSLFADVMCANSAVSVWTWIQASIRGAVECIKEDSDVSRRQAASHITATEVAVNMIWMDLQQHRRAREKRVVVKPALAEEIVWPSLSRLYNSKPPHQEIMEWMVIVYKLPATKLRTELLSCVESLLSLAVQTVADGRTSVQDLVEYVAGVIMDEGLMMLTCHLEPRTFAVLVTNHVLNRLQQVTLKMEANAEGDEADVNPVRVKVGRTASHTDVRSNSQSEAHGGSSQRLTRLRRRPSRNGFNHP